ncbi:diacylglycerol kinase [Bradyrhizobium erythrophlei]|uniref:Diacylglycerol kinase n=1 Tax=Bradyrhizobium erythrophlei TaxID=1437360 RepID=A0A1M7SS20_9BRAD|nr:diacylglycerol kinase [Bradyrhizobium erythrophlei]SHN61218.1 diacylglycerol kinase [Bradyrhizobium erythrophlei]
MLRLWRATINTRNGLVFAIRSEQAVREELVALAISLPLAWLIGASTMRRIELVAAVAMVLVVELLNTAIEKLADRLTTDHDPQIGRVKDMGSAAVGVALVTAGVFWLFAIAERMGVI